MKIYREEPYYENDQERNFFITLDVLKMFVNPETNKISHPTLCADVLTVVQPIIKNAEVFKDAIKEPFDPNDVIDCLVDVVWPAFVERNGGVVPDRPKIEKAHGVGRLPVDGNRYDWVYWQLLSYLYNRHENRHVEIVDHMALRRDLKVYMPLIRAMSHHAKNFAGMSDDAVAQTMVQRREESEPKLREIIDSEHIHEVG